MNKMEDRFYTDMRDWLDNNPLGKEFLGYMKGEYDCEISENLSNPHMLFRIVGQRDVYKHLERIGKSMEEQK